MRQAKKLGLLGLSVIALVAAFGIIAGMTGIAPVSAQETKVCTGSGPGGAAVAGGTETCQVTSTALLPVVGASLQTAVTNPVGVGVTCAPAAGFTLAPPATPAGCVFVAGAITPAGTIVGSFSFILPAGSTGTLTDTATACLVAVVPCPAASVIVTGAGILATGPGAALAGAAANAIPTLAPANFVKTCVPTAVVAGSTVATFPITTTCRIVVTAPVGTTLTGDVLSSDTITGANATFTLTGNVTAPVSPTILPPLFIGAVSCAEGIGGIVNAAGTTLTCTLPPIQVTASSTMCESITITDNAAPAVSSTTNNVCAAGFVPTVPVVPGAGVNQPTDENKFCTNTATNSTLTQVIGTSNQSLSVTGPAKNFVLPLFGGASTCLIQVDKGLTAGVATPCSAANPCADGYIIVTLTTLGSGAAISCASAALPAGQTLPAAGNNGGTCQQQSLSTQLNIPCGVTAGTPAANTTVSATCTNVSFDIQAALGACINSPTSACPNPGAGFTGGTATVTVQFLATPANGGTVGGIQLGTNNFTFQAPGIGTLLVTATPQLIPSNGTLASVVTATFGCGQGFNLVNGFPLSSLGIASTSVNQPILGASGLGGTSTVCGDGLPGTFNFTTPGNVLFDNGRSSEAVSCGLNGQQNIFGGTNFFNPNGFSATAPLVFTCSGAAVLVIGAGAAGDAPINVTYTSAVGGLTAIGSTLITVSPSGVPRISVACNPSTIAAGNTGSLCTATVTDQNGVPLTGVTGATVTFTVSDTTVATILPCVVNVAGAINITTSPNVIPQIVPNTPCQTPTGQIPGQENTFINGQATALLVASNYAHPETVTVSASLGVLIPPSFSCLTTPFTPLTLNQVLLGSSTVNSNGLVGLNGGVTGCGLGNATGFTGLASGFSVAGSGGLTGIVTLPNTTSASTTVNIGGVAGILIAGATTTSPLQLVRGCNQVVVTSTNGTPIANIAALVSPTSAVVSIWRFSNGTKQFQAGFFSDPAAPTDFLTTGLSTATTNGGATINPNGVAGGTQITESYFVCVNQASTIVSG